MKRFIQASAILTALVLIGCSNGTTSSGDPEVGEFSAARSSNRSNVRFSETGDRDLTLSNFATGVPIPFTLSNIGNTTIQNVQITADDPSVIVINFPTAGQTLEPMETFAVTAGFTIEVKQGEGATGPNEVTVTGTYVDEEGVEQNAEPFVIELSNYTDEYQDWKFEWSADNITWTEFNGKETHSTATNVRIVNLGTVDLQVNFSYFNLTKTYQKVDATISAGKVSERDFEDVSSEFDYLTLRVVSNETYFQVRSVTEAELLRN